MPRDTLTRDQIVRTAVELLDAEGLEGLNMRALGKRLDSAATAVYWHVKNKDNLVLLATDQVWGELEAARPGRGRLAHRGHRHGHRPVRDVHPAPLAGAGLRRTRPLRREQGPPRRPQPRRLRGRRLHRRPGRPGRRRRLHLRSRQRGRRRRDRLTHPETHPGRHHRRRTVPRRHGQGPGDRHALPAPARPPGDPSGGRLRRRSRQGLRVRPPRSSSTAWSSKSPHSPAGRAVPRRRPNIELHKVQEVSCTMFKSCSNVVPATT